MKNRINYFRADHRCSLSEDKRLLKPLNGSSLEIVLERAQRLSRLQRLYSSSREMRNESHFCYHFTKDLPLNRPRQFQHSRRPIIASQLFRYLPGGSSRVECREYERRDSPRETIDRPRRFSSLLKIYYAKGSTRRTCLSTTRYFSLLMGGTEENQQFHTMKGNGSQRELAEKCFRFNF